MPRGKTKPPSKHVRFLTVGQAALHVGLERSTIKRAYDDGTIPSAFLPGAAKRVRRARRSDVEAYLAAFEADLQAAR